MDDHKLRIFNAIASFVQDLNVSFGKKYKPVALYCRLVEKTLIRDVVAVDRHIAAFNRFFSTNANYIQKQVLTNSSRVEYSERIYLDISTILRKTDKDAHKHIHKHLVTIYSLLNLGTTQGMKALETLKKPDSVDGELELNLPDTTEGRFVKDTVTSMMDEFKDMGDNPNPMLMVSNMMQSGFIQKFFGDLQSKFSNGEMNIGSLMSTVTGVISNSPGGSGEDAEKLRNFMSQSMGQLSNLTGGQELPAEIQGQMTGLLNALGGAGGNPLTQPVAPKVIEEPADSEKDSN